jgi:hypothetical protein
MLAESKHEGGEANPPGDLALIGIRIIESRKIGVLIGALSGIWIAQGIVMWSDDPSGRGVVLWVTSVMVASLVALGLAIRGLLTSFQSPLRYVFSGRRMLAFGSFMLIIAALLAGSIARRNLFHQLLTNGHISASDVADAGFVMALMTCATGGCVALLLAWDAVRDERAWYTSLGVHRH